MCGDIWGSYRKIEVRREGGGEKEKKEWMKGPNLVVGWDCQCWGNPVDEI